MGEELKWLVGIGITLSIFAFGAISTALYRTSQAMKDGDDELHQRINKVRDEYVRRDDKDKSDARIEAMVKEIRDEQRAYHKDVLALLAKRQN